MPNEKDETVSPAREWLRRNSQVLMPRCPICDVIHAANCEREDILCDLLDAFGSHVSSLSSQAIGAAAKEAAEKIWADVEHQGFKQVKELDAHVIAFVKHSFEAIILRAIEKARIK